MIAKGSWVFFIGLGSLESLAGRLGCLAALASPEPLAFFTGGSEDEFMEEILEEIWVAMSKGRMRETVSATSL